MVHQIQKTISLLLLLTLCLCGRAGKVTLQPIVRIDPPPIVDGETCVYEIADKNNSQVAIRRVITTRVQYAELPAFQVTTLEQETKNSPPIESTVVYISREDLTPIASFKFSRPPKPLITTAAIYQEAFAEIVSITKEGEFKRHIPIGAHTFDVNQLTMLGRTLRFAQAKPYNILIVVPTTTPPGGMSLAGKVSPPNIDTITTPAGTFECYKLIIESDSTKQQLWFEKIGARRLIQLIDGKTGETVRLISSSIPQTPVKIGATTTIGSHKISNETK